MPKCTRLDDQWDYCDRCGFLTPLHQLIRDYELKLCERGCRDDIDREIHMRLVAKIMSQPSNESRDRRNDLYFKPSDTDVI